jgi:glycosyltransferase involved in cell wall biosynthesis
MIICNSLGTGGAEKQTVALANKLHRRGWQVYLVYLLDARDLFEEVDESLKPNVYYIQKKKYFDINAIIEIRKLINKFSINSILSVNEGPLLSAIFARAFNFKIKLIAGFHTTVLRKNERIAFYLTSWWLFKLATKVVYVCKTQMDYWSARFLHMPGSGMYIYNGVDTEKFGVELKANGLVTRGDLSIPQDAILLLSIAMLRPEKGHLDMVRMLARLNAIGIETYLVCVGDGPEKNNINNLANSLNVMEKLRMQGRSNDVRPYLGIADATLIFSNSVETFSIAVLESLSCGCPVLAYDIGGIKEQIIDRDFGKVLRHGDEAGFIEEIKKLKSSSVPDIKNKIHKKIETMFSEDMMTAEYEKIL